MGQIFGEGNEGTAGVGETGASRLRHSIYLEGKPHPKERPRVTKTGVTYTPEKTRNAEKKIALAWDGPCFKSPVALYVVVDEMGTSIIVSPIDVDQSSKLRGDLDNYLKTIMDALNGIAWDDDKQVVRIEAVKL